MNIIYKGNVRPKLHIDCNIKIYVITCDVPDMTIEAHNINTDEITFIDTIERTAHIKHRAHWSPKTFKIDEKEDAYLLIRTPFINSFYIVEGEVVIGEPNTINLFSLVDVHSIFLAKTGKLSCENIINSPDLCIHLSGASELHTDCIYIPCDTLDVTLKNEALLNVKKLSEVKSFNLKDYRKNGQEAFFDHILCRNLTVDMNHRKKSSFYVEKYISFKYGKLEYCNISIPCSLNELPEGVRELLKHTKINENVSINFDPPKLNKFAPYILIKAKRFSNTIFKNIVVDGKFFINLNKSLRDTIVSSCQKSENIKWGFDAKTHTLSFTNTGDSFVNLDICQNINHIKTIKMKNHAELNTREHLNEIELIDLENSEIKASHLSFSDCIVNLDYSTMKIQRLNGNKIKINSHHSSFLGNLKSYVAKATYNGSGRSHIKTGNVFISKLRINAKNSCTMNFFCEDVSLTKNKKSFVLFEGLEPNFRKIMKDHDNVKFKECLSTPDNQYVSVEKVVLFQLLAYPYPSEHITSSNRAHVIKGLENIKRHDLDRLTEADVNKIHQLQNIYIKKTNKIAVF